ncbi:hypothetical protein [Mesorhizobium sp. 131-2-1]|uniref:hypothetical protein n=1 Tax=Mesorhizobium sp. 131-2-1 TaxID=2744518 RepID=UPI0019283875|nr:hypothetical protein [Mesorhizobium sp. 131-2-1]
MTLPLLSGDRVRHGSHGETGEESKPSARFSAGINNQRDHDPCDDLMQRLMSPL